MGRPVEYFGAYTKLLSILRLNHSSAGTNKAKILCGTISRYLFKMAPAMVVFIFCVITSTDDEPLKFASQRIAPFLLVTLNLKNVSSLHSKVDQLNALINLVPSASTNRVRAQLKWREIYCKIQIGGFSAPLIHLNYKTTLISSLTKQTRAKIFIYIVFSFAGIAVHQMLHVNADDEKILLLQKSHEMFVHANIFQKALLVTSYVGIIFAFLT